MPSAILNCEQLEHRSLPAGFQWIGGVSTDWQDKANWEEASGGIYGAATRWPGEMTVQHVNGQDVYEQHNDDEVLINNTIVNHTAVVQRDCKLSSGSTITIKNFSFYSIQPACVEVTPNRKFTISNQTVLFISGANSNDLRLILDGKKTSVEINDRSAIKVFNGVGQWSSPSLTSNATGNVNAEGRLDLNGVTFDINNDAETLSVSIYITKCNDAQDNPVLGKVRVSGGLAPLKKNIAITKAKITVADGGTLSLDNTANSDTLGGFSDGTDSEIVITTGGTLRRVKDTQDTDNNLVYLQIAPLVTNNGGTVKLEEKSSLDLKGGYKQTDGTVDGVKSRVKLPNGKKFSLLGGVGKFYALGQSGNCLIDGELEVANATLSIGNNTGGGQSSVFCVLDVTGNVTLGTGSSLSVSADLATNGLCDSLHSSGTIYLQGQDVSLVCALVNTAPLGQGFNNAYSVVSGASVSGSWASVTRTGFSGGVFWHTVSSGNTVVHLQVTGSDGGNE